MSTKANRIERYYDTHEMEGAELTESRLHRAVIMQLILIIQRIFNGKSVGVTGNINLYQTDNPRESAKSPDITVIEGLETAPKRELEDTPSYYVGEDGPPPLVIFEIASRETWKQDLEDKPSKYEAMGVQEYFVFDPNTRTLWTGQWRGSRRLIGWRKNPTTGKFDLLKRNPDGRLWSEELQSWLVVEDTELKLYAADGTRRLTGEEAETHRANHEARLKEMEKRRASLFEQQAKVEARRAETARKQVEAEREQNLKLKEMLRKLGHNPDDLL